MGKTLLMRCIKHLPYENTTNMCFSPEASFAGGGMILLIGYATIKKVQKPSQMVFATIPLIFGVQQITEGLLWSTLPYSEYENIQKISKYLFLIIADVIWPVMMPLSVLLMEKSDKRKRILRILLGIGIALSLYYAYCLLVYNVNPKIIGYHIQYTNDFPKSLMFIAFAIYLVATITPLFVSSIKRTHLLGALMFLSGLVTAVFFKQYLTSVWCFFAALMSGVIYWILRDSKREIH